MARTSAALLAALALAAGCHHAPPAEPPPAPEAPPTAAEHDALVHIAALASAITTALGTIAATDDDHKAEALAALAPQVSQLVDAADQLADRTRAPACEAGVAAAAHAVARDFHALVVGDPADRTALAGSLQRSFNELAARRRACGVADPTPASPSPPG